MAVGAQPTPIGLKRGIEKAVEAAKNQAKHLESHDQIATPPPCRRRPEIGEVIAQGGDTLGMESVIDVE